jgi:hypothetical protein
MTTKQRKFSWLVATGLPKSQAYAKAYDSRGNPNTRAKNAHVLSRKPAISKAIIEFEERLLAVADLRAEKINVLTNLKALALSPDVSDKVRLEASVALLEFCEKWERAQAGQEKASS